MPATMRNFALVLTLAVASAITSVAFAQATAGSAPPTLATVASMGNIDELAKTRQVIALHAQGHGNTADIDRP